MNYRVEFSRRAARYFERQQRRVQERIDQRLDQLVERPNDPSLSIALSGRPGTRRARVGDLRLIFEVFNETRTLVIVDIGPRGDIYKD